MEPIIHFSITLEKKGKVKTISVLGRDIDHAMQKATQLEGENIIFLNVESKTK